MFINKNQAAEILHVSTHKIDKLVEENKLKDHSVKRDGAKKVYPKFILSDVNKLKKELKIKRVSKPSIKLEVTPISIMSRLQSIESKVDQLIAIWK